MKKRIDVFVCLSDMGLLHNEDDPIILRSRNKHYLYGLKTSLDIDLYAYDIIEIIENTDPIFFREGLKKNIISSFKLASNFSEKEGMDTSLEAKDKVFGTVYQIFNKMLNEKDLNKSIFDYFAEILFKLIKNHHLKNGNKRIAFACLLTFMELSGFYFQQGTKYQEVEDKILQFATSKEEDGGLLDEENLIEIKKFIKNNAIIYSQKIQEEYGNEKNKY